MSLMAELLERVHQCRCGPVDLDADYRVWITASPGSAPVETVARLRSVVHGGAVHVEAEIQWWRPAVDLGPLGFMVDLTPAIAACSVQLRPDTVLAGRHGWHVSLAPGPPPLAFPHVPPTPLRLFPYPSEAAAWDIVVDKERGVVLSLNCRVDGELRGGLEVLPSPAPARPPASSYDDVPQACRDAGIDVDGQIVAYMKEFSDSCHLVVECRDLAAAQTAAAAACAALLRIAHPEQPDFPLPSFVSGVEERREGVLFEFDMHDAEGYDGLVEHVLAVVLDAMAASGLRNARLTYLDP